MEETSSGNAGLMRRIVQLERAMMQTDWGDRVLRNTKQNATPVEKEELQRDVETLCMQKSGFSGGLDIVSRLQARRAAGLEQELEGCKQKLAFQTEENLSLQEELAESYKAKGRTADAFKAAMDKNKGLEAEVKYYQSRMAAAFAERDKTHVEVQKLQSREVTLGDDVEKLQSRLAQSQEVVKEQEEKSLDLLARLETSNAENEMLQKVVQKFWTLRGGPDNLSIHDATSRAQILFEEDSTLWRYGETEFLNWKNKCDQAELKLGRSEEQLLQARDEVKDLRQGWEEELDSRIQLENRIEAREKSILNFETQIEKLESDQRNAEEKASNFSERLAVVLRRLNNELHQLQAQYHSTKVEVLELIGEEKNGMTSVFQTLLSELENRTHVPDRNGELSTSYSLVGETRNSEIEEPTTQQLQNTTCSRSTREEENHDVTLPPNVDDESKIILAQAMREKVEALLLLSQQEERHYLDTSKMLALSKQVTEVKEKLAQVTSEKISALLDVASLRSEVEYLQGRERELLELLYQHRSTNASGRLLPASWTETQFLPIDSGIIAEGVGKTVVKPKVRATSSKGYLKSWFKGFDLSSAGFYSNSTVGIRTSSGYPSTSSDSSESNSGVARLLVENAALQERVASIQHLAKSAQRLRMSLFKVATDLEGQPDRASVGAALDIVETVKIEATRLKVALGCSLPVSYQGALENAPEEVSPVSLTNGSEGQTNFALDAVSLAGVEIAELLLATSELQRSAFKCKLDSLPVHFLE